MEAHLQHWSENLDPLNFSVVRLEMFFDDLSLGYATGFFLAAPGTQDIKAHYWLVTNWHVLAGRNPTAPEEKIFHPQHTPNRIKFMLTAKPTEQTKAQYPRQIFSTHAFFDLYYPDGKAKWVQHRNTTQFDVAAIALSPEHTNGWNIVGVNEIAYDVDMKMEVGDRALILGYPLGFTHINQLPIWKGGTVASDPYVDTDATNARVVIDATTRGGMSGSPVIARQRTHYVNEENRIIEKHNATLWLGIYSSRPILAPAPHLMEEDRRAEVGYYIRGFVVGDVTSDPIPGPNFTP